MKAVVSYLKLSEMCRTGLNQKEMAKSLKVDKSTVSKALKKFKLEATKVMALKCAGEAVDAEMQILQQLNSINRDTQELLTTLKGKDDLPEKTLYLKAIGEVRQQIRLCCDILTSLIDTREVKQFQEDTLNAIKEADPATARKIYDKLNQRRLSRTAVQYN